MNQSRLLTATIALALTFFCHSCQDDNEVSAAYRQDLADIEVSQGGGGATLTRDDGTRLTIDNSEILGTLAQNAVYRVLAVYVETDKSAHLYACNKVLSPAPETINEQSILRDPVKKVLAVWRGGRYVNLHLMVSTTNHSQHFAFADKGIKQSPDGSKIWHIELYHNQNKDGHYYSREIFLSCPVEDKRGLQEGKDSVEIEISTYNGTITKKLRY